MFSGKRIWDFLSKIMLIKRVLLIVIMTEGGPIARIQELKECLKRPVFCLQSYLQIINLILR